MVHPLTTPASKESDHPRRVESLSTNTHGVNVADSALLKSSWTGNLFWSLLVLVAFVAGWMAALMRVSLHDKEKLPANEMTTIRRSAAVTVTAEPIAARNVQRSVEAFGTLHGFEEVSISARIEGRVRKILHDVADRVTPAELLLEIDPTDYDLAVQQADRALQVELAKLGLKQPPQDHFEPEKVPFVAKAKSLMGHAKARLERISRLAASKTVSAEEAENAANEYRTSEAEYENQIHQAETDLATIQMKQVDLAVAQEQLANTKVLTPVPSVQLPEGDQISYVISQRPVAEGTLVRPGTEIFRVVIDRVLKLRVPVPERFSSEVKLHQRTNVYAATSTTPFPGTVTRIYPTVEPTTRTFQVEIQVRNQNGDLKPGSFAKATIFTRIDPEATTVPLSALIQFAGITKIFLVDKDRAKEVPVTLGTQTTEWVEISEPVLPRGALVITSGQSAIANETRVSVRENDQ